ncbi:MAG: rhomboid family intramembrane serine protease [Flavobacteriaceae bacterium]|jgi:membrane associated rhomboid family serine protease|nr:rhomboid family intramembrane serine protease [Flavobacteriaceae bacterium]MBT3920689.1 rhomboid family intramembrane serine protease [Flavobacteriaceae bacterium]MBT6705829.1 rhomboid family intramembrane serine protease [Flavobacteriaceae bacterium]
MTKKNNLYFSNDVLLFPLLFLLTIVIVFWIESRFNINLNYLGIYPRKIEGLIGIICSPFIHGDVKHLFNNAIPLLVLTSALFYFYRRIRWKVLIYGLLLTGLFTWIIGRSSIHIGASGVIYMLTAFLMFRGILSKHYQLTALSFSVIFLYGGFIWYIFPTDPKISWEGHLSGFIVGIIFALIFNKQTLPVKKYIWEKEDYNPDNDPFMKNFDKDGNFIETTSETEVIEPQIESTSIKYIFKKSITKEKKDL